MADHKTFRKIEFLKSRYSDFFCKSANLFKQFKLLAEGSD